MMTREFDFEEEDILEENVEKDKRRARRRKNNVRKAIRKKRITDSIHNDRMTDGYEYLHQYSKNKVQHSYRPHLFREWASDEIAHSVKMRELSMKEKLNEYEKGYIL